MDYISVTAIVLEHIVMSTTDWNFYGQTHFQPISLTMKQMMCRNAKTLQHLIAFSEDFRVGYTLIHLKPLIVQTDICFNRFKKDKDLFYTGNMEGNRERMGQHAT